MVDVPLWQVSVDLETSAGTLSLFSWTGGALPGAGETFLVEPMSFRWARAEGAPAQPEPVECRFALLVPGPVLVDIGRRVSVRLVEYPTADEIVGFHGRVTDCPTTPVEYFADGAVRQGMYVDVVAVDPTVDLAEANSTTGILAAGDPVFRGPAYIAGIDPDDMPSRWGDAAQGLPGTDYGLDSWVDVKAEDAGTGKALERIVGLLDQVGMGVLPASPNALERRLATRAILAPRVDASTIVWDYPDSAAGQGDWFRYDEPPPTYDRTDPTDFPAELVDGPDGWTVAIDPDSPLVVDAARVDFAAMFTRSKFTHPNRAEVTYTPTGGSDPALVVVEADDRDADAPVVAVALDAPLLGDEYAAGRMALVYLPENDAADRWQADAFRYYPPDWSRLLAASWFPRHHDVDLVSPGVAPGDPATRAECYTIPVVVDGIDPAHNPTGRSWYAGQLTSVQLTLAGAQPVVEFTLRRVLPVPDGAGALTYDDLSVVPTYADFDPSLTYYDLRLARGA